ncbi:hypothetical protein AQJ30_15750 [Streptomyces longwoodensis]|uniref:Uncharacterized protein n=1 Tax=Streptomyces longwoodensis TaxID=68231 RepID=A0A117QNA4_9ACTN|nr:hypothetical protein [Streptomyces longwoodensis]KUN37736.1 hypothetical protein AQJ30_15750 [Streptomyces longwoodensis]
MPNRRRVIECLLQDAIGAQVFNGLIGECVSIPNADYEAVKDAATAILERVAEAVDWRRLLREAAARHATVHPDYQPDHLEWSGAEGVCGACLEEALLADDIGFQDWERTPEAPRDHEHTDWPAIVARNLHHRDTVAWHPYKQPAD